MLLLQLILIIMWSIINNIVNASPDTNECGSANGGCAHYCSNTLGSFTCSCSSGFVLAGNNLNCTGKTLCTVCLTVHDTCPADVDECSANIDGCAQSCTNTVGSYQCGCGAGYTLNSDGHTCDGMIMYYQPIMVLCANYFRYK